MVWTYWCLVCEEFAFEVLGFTHPDQFWTLTRREFGLIADGHRKRHRVAMEEQAHFVIAIISQIPLRGRHAKAPTVEQLIGPSEEDILERKRKLAKALKNKK